MKNFSMILATDDKNGIGKANDLAWRIQADMKHFLRISTSTKDPAKVNALIMGRKTWESIPGKFRPLPGRINCVLSRDEKLELNGAATYTNFDACLKDLSDMKDIENVFVIGGSFLYNGLLGHEQLETIFLTHVEGDYDCDIFFNGVPDTFRLHSMSSEQKENDKVFYFAEYKKKEA